MATAQSRGQNEFYGPWELFEVLAEEFRELDPEMPGISADVWRYRETDILSPPGVLDRIADVGLPPQPAGGRLRFALLGRGPAARLLRLLTRTAELQGVRDNVAAASPPTVVETLNATLASDPVDVVRVCWRFLEGEGARPLRHNIPDRADFADPTPVTERFNRLVLDGVLRGLVRPAADRALAEVYQAAQLRERRRDHEGSPRARWALCLSGGGIRSASFSLGVIQGLARQRVLRRFDYLSTVSGGGYIGSWLTAWMSREGRSAVATALGEPMRDGAAAPAKFPLDPEPWSIRYLRSFSNYLAPNKGWFGADMWTLGATVVRNLILNWLVVLPVLAVVLTVPLFAAAVAGNPPPSGSPLAWGVAILTSVGFAGAVMGVQFVHTRRPEGGDELLDCDRVSPEIVTSKRVAKARGERAFLVRCLLPIVVAAAALNTVWVWVHPELTGRSAAPDQPLIVPPGLLALIVFGVAAHVVGWLWAVWRLGFPHGWSRRLREGVAVLVTGGVVGAVIYWAAGWIGSASISLIQSHQVAFDSIGDAIGGVAPAAVYAMLALPSFIASLVVAGFLFVGITSRDRFDEEREWSSRYSAWLLLVAFGWLALAAIVVFSGVVLTTVGRLIASAVAAAASGGGAAMLGKSAHTPDSKRSESAAPSGAGALARKYGLALAAPIGVILSLITIAATVTRIVAAAVRLTGARGWPPAVVAGVGATLLLAGIVLALLIDVNKFSLHAMYRARLIRAYLGASRRRCTRHPNPFTGFDPADNLNMHCLCDNTPRTEPTRTPDSHDKPPIHVLNLALNLSSAGNLEWQDRKARSFTVTQFHAGAWGVGYRRTRLANPTSDAGAYYGGDHGITLGTAMAISGAAASPNMGYHSSPAVTFLMALFNARLGWWLGNPGWAGGRKAFHCANPGGLISPIFAELLSLTTDSERAVYLSDGGHFENLGLYEAVVRRCRMIVVVDASSDERCTLDDLGNAIRKIRVDFGIPIDFDASAFEIAARGPDGEVPETGAHVAYGTVRYSEIDLGADDGELIYIKPALTGDEPHDVLSYARASASFPHESTADQFFSETQLESYRALGVHSVEGLIKDIRQSGSPAASRTATIGKYSVRASDLFGEMETAADRISN